MSSFPVHSAEEHASSHSVSRGLAHCDGKLLDYSQIASTSHRSNSSSIQPVNVLERDSRNSGASPSAHQRTSSMEGGHLCEMTDTSAGITGATSAITAASTRQSSILSRRKTPLSATNSPGTTNPFGLFPGASTSGVGGAAACGAPFVEERSALLSSSPSPMMMPTDKETNAAAAAAAAAAAGSPNVATERTAASALEVPVVSHPMTQLPPRQEEQPRQLKTPATAPATAQAGESSNFLDARPRAGGSHHHSHRRRRPSGLLNTPSPTNTATTPTDEMGGRRKRTPISIDGFEYWEDDCEMGNGSGEGMSKDSSEDNDLLERSVAAAAATSAAATATATAVNSTSSAVTQRLKSQPAPLNLCTLKTTSPEVKETSNHKSTVKRESGPPAVVDKKTQGASRLLPLQLTDSTAIIISRDRRAEPSAFATAVTRAIHKRGEQPLLSSSSPSQGTMTSGAGGGEGGGADLVHDDTSTVLSRLHMMLQHHKECSSNAVLSASQAGGATPATRRSRSATMNTFLAQFAPLYEIAIVEIISECERRVANASAAERDRQLKQLRGCCNASLAVSAHSFDSPASFQVSPFASVSHAPSTLGGCGGGVQTTIDRCNGGTSRFSSVLAGGNGGGASAMSGLPPVAVHERNVSQSFSCSFASSACGARPPAPHGLVATSGLGGVGGPAVGALESPTSPMAAGTAGARCPKAGSYTSFPSHLDGGAAVGGGGGRGPRPGLEFLSPTESIQQLLCALDEHMRYQESAPLVFLAALAYLSRFTGRCVSAHGSVTSANWFRMTTMAVLTASKMYNEYHTRRLNRVFAQVSGIPLHEVSRLELDFLYLLDFDLMLEEKDVEEWVQWMEALAARHNMVTPLHTFLVGGRGAASSAVAGSGPGENDHEGEDGYEGEEDHSAQPTPARTLSALVVGSPRFTDSPQSRLHGLGSFLSPSELGNSAATTTMSTTMMMAGGAGAAASGLAIPITSISRVPPSTHEERHMSQGAENIHHPRHTHNRGPATATADDHRLFSVVHAPAEPRTPVTIRELSRLGATPPSPLAPPMKPAAASPVSFFKRSSNAGGGGSPSLVSGASRSVSFLSQQPQHQQHRDPAYAGRQGGGSHSNLKNSNCTRGCRLSNVGGAGGAGGGFAFSLGNTTTTLTSDGNDNRYVTHRSRGQPQEQQQLQTLNHSLGTTATTLTTTAAGASTSVLAANPSPTTTTVTSTSGTLKEPRGPIASTLPAAATTSAASATSASATSWRGNGFGVMQRMRDALTVTASLVRGQLNVMGDNPDDDNADNNHDHHRHHRQHRGLVDEAETAGTHAVSVAASGGGGEPVLVSAAESKNGSSASVAFPPKAGSAANTSGTTTSASPGERARRVNRNAAAQQQDEEKKNDDAQTPRRGTNHRGTAAANVSPSVVVVAAPVQVHASFYPASGPLSPAFSQARAGPRIGSPQSQPRRLPLQQQQRQQQPCPHAEPEEEEEWGEVEEECENEEGYWDEYGYFHYYDDDEGCYDEEGNFYAYVDAGADDEGYPYGGGYEGQGYGQEMYGEVEDDDDFAEEDEDEDVLSDEAGNAAVFRPPPRTHSPPTL